MTRAEGLEMWTRGVVAACLPLKRKAGAGQFKPTIPMLLLALLLSAGCAQEITQRSISSERFTFDHGAIVRGDRAQRQIALIFTGGEHGEGTPHILDVLRARGIKASFFVTGDFIRKDEHKPYLRRVVAEGHYLGPHSDTHPLYCPWEDRKRTLVTEEFFREDLQRNIEDLRRFGALKPGAPVWFIPPYEWFNEDQVEWARRMGVGLFNFTPGTGSNRDWAPEGHKSFVPGQVIMDDILAYERKNPDGLNGFLLLLHLGAQREDKAWRLLEPLVVELAQRGYRFVRVDEMLGRP
ncbi:MAG TPA: polysaccharide deacetylase family protein [Phycisphaerae bacterium]|nr:polysaccharide deacetylase family protein [Phycisphaerae bacterium]HOB74076.1 polysaccharide deacetylase family protein [Phycisphaerae bacterium]HOJ56482.1 polysaccharide deacetylase family protein [Phycisphaerae bacterium]HOL25398.1 polysaccharide deacetylase family protein [Phycisphaerae bacterium]HPP22074.1 polysaccharide deacetylase family protein [Phycisphaerae bacterium]